MNKKPEKPQYVLVLKVGRTYHRFPIKEGKAIEFRIVKAATVEELAE